VDFLATQFGWVWTWLYTFSPIPWLSFILVVVVAWSPFDLWKIFDARARLRKIRHLSH
jgi:hypothetical protein